MPDLLERTGTTGFPEFVAARSGRLLQVAYLLTRDWALAEDLLQTSLAKAWSAWRRIEGDPEPYIRKVLVNTYTTWWRRRWNGERPTAELPERPGPDDHHRFDERDRIQRALGRLPKQQRAVLVLRYYEDMSELEIAETLGIAPGTVKSHAVKGLANLRLDASLTPESLRLEEPAGTARLAGVVERVQQRRRRKVAAVVTACAVVLAAILGYAIRPTHRSMPQPATSPSTVNGFPRFQSGTQLAATTSVSALHREGQLKWQPTANDVKLFVKCSASTREVNVWLEFSVGGTVLDRTGCANESSGTSGFWWDDSEIAVAGRVHQGTIDVRITGATVAGTDDDVPVPADFVADIAVGERIPFDAYPLPPAPSELQPLFTNGFDRRDGSIHVDADPAGPLRPVSVPLRWGGWEIYVALDAPGALSLAVNGVVFSTCEKWDYSSGGGCGYAGTLTDADLKKLGLRPGQLVTLTVTPSHVGHSWQVWIAPLR